MSSNKTILVTGITGKQGGAVARELKKKGYQVRGLTRNPGSEAAKGLAAQGYEIVQGDFSKPDSIESAIEGVEAVFAMSTPFEAGMQAETAQGITIADAAKKAGVFLIYTSVAGANLNTGIPHFDSKYKVEQYIEGLGLDYTIIAPVYFMENLYFPQTKEALDNGTYASPLPKDTQLQQVALADIGSLASFIIDHRETFVGKRIEIASDTTTSAEETELLSKALGKKIEYFEVPMEQIRAMSDDFAIMYEWFIKHGYHVDTDALRKDYPQVGWHTLESWIGEQKFN